MQYVDNGGEPDAAVNLALDEYLVRHGPPDLTLLLFYVNAPAIVLGRHQNAAEEINAPFVRERRIQVVRRISGGGAVYHDLGNLNFSIIAGYRPERFNRYEEFTRPVIEVLRDLGVPAELGPRNNITAAGRKLSGNAQFVGRGRMLSHGTLLVDSNLEDVACALRAPAGAIQSRATRSIRSQVANISEFVATPITPAALRDLVLERVSGQLGEVQRYELTGAAWRQVHELADQRYRSWEWNYGESPRFTVERTARLPAGGLGVRCVVDRPGLIESTSITAEFLEAGELAVVEQALFGVRYSREDIGSVLAAVMAPDRFREVTAGQLLDMLHP